MTAYVRVEIQVHAFSLPHWKTDSSTFCIGDLNIKLHIYNVHLLWHIQTTQAQAYRKQQKQTTVLSLSLSVHARACVCECVCRTCRTQAHAVNWLLILCYRWISAGRARCQKMLCKSPGLWGGVTKFVETPKCPRQSRPTHKNFLGCVLPT